MKVLVVADIHDNLPNLKKCLAFCSKNKITIMICCGDVANSETLEFIAANFSGNIYLVRGNMEIYDEAEIKAYENIKYLGRYGRAEIDNKKIGICHEPAYIDHLINLCLSEKISSEEKINSGCDIIFYGHTHKPWSSLMAIKNNSLGKNEKKILTVNPGTLSGTFSRPTFAVWDTKTNNMELKLLEMI
jgi:putative phosphoesterase